MPATIRDLAQKLNLSITQVSRALGGYSDVSQATREKVIAAAREMGYEPSYAARQLRRRRADALGFILPTSSPRFTDPFHTDFLAGLCDEAAAHQLDLVVTSCPPGSKAEETIYRRWFQSSRVDGMILNRVRVQDWRVQYLFQQGLPFVTLGAASAQAEHPYISVNERGGFERMVKYLHGKGHRRFAYIGGPAELVIQQERLAGFLTGVKVAGLQVEERLIVETELTGESGYRAARRLLALPQPPTALLCCNDQLAIGALQAAKELGLRIGDEVAIAGYDGIRETAFTEPPLTTLLQPTYDIARRLVNMLCAMINHEALALPAVTLEPEIIVRAST